MLPQRIRRHAGAMLVGTAVTAAAVVLQGAGAMRPFEWLVLDLLFAHVNQIDADPDIVHVDIDDSSVLRGRWPWSRCTQAGFVRVLHELGARRIVLDLTYVEREDVAVDLLGNAGMNAAPGASVEFAEVTAEQLVFPDDELAAAIHNAGDVHLAMFYRERDALTVNEQRVLEALVAAPEADVGALAEATGLPAAVVASLPRASLRRRAILRRVSQYLAEHPAATLRAVHESITEAPFESVTPIGENIAWAYDREQAVRAVLDRAPPVPEALKGRIPRIVELTPSLRPFVVGAAACGFVVFETDDDHALRRVPLVVAYRGRLLMQLAFGSACEELRITPDDLSIDDGGSLRIAGRGDRPPMRVQLDPRQRMLVNWHRAGTNWVDSFAHVSMAKVLEAYDARERIDENERLGQVRFAEAMRLAKDEAAFAGYREQVKQFLATRRRLRRMELDPDADAAAVEALRAAVAAQRAPIDADHAATVSFIDEIWAELRDSDASDPELADDYKRFQRAYAIVHEEIPAIEAANARLAAQEEAALDDLRGAIEGKVCFVGYTATAVADMVDTPVYARLPGVMVHSNVYNTFLQRRFIRWARPWMNALLVVAVGAIVTLVSVTHGPRAAFSIVAAIMLVLAVGGGIVLFGLMQYWVAVVTPVVVAFATWAMVVMYRFLVSEREKRRFSRALAQYTSPAIARQIADKLDEVDLSPVEGDVTCFFSDLAGFTTLTEKYLDPAKTRAVLNPYLEAMSEALNAHAALINKFMGDGIFAFFNPPIYPCAEHARQACAAALVAQEALSTLIERHESDPLAHVFDKLRMRIGVATGPVYVGDYGSENKLDYTCMGDTVNLAARLEPANKAFGTRIMVAHATKEAAGDGFAYRPLGALQVVGKALAVPVYELLGRVPDVPSTAVYYAERFGAAVAAYQARRWDEAAAAFEALRTERPDDLACTCYLDIIAVFRESPPAEGWNGAVELTHK
jgi:class 3 adenylate cyclase/CHASE2 domain-containing sensor protein